jgi:hypothetical protein
LKKSRHQGHPEGSLKAVSGALQGTRINLHPIARSSSDLS